MTNCKTCLHYNICPNRIDDLDTYKLCDNYCGTCISCVHNNKNIFCECTCDIIGAYCEDINHCGYWEDVLIYDFGDNKARRDFADSDMCDYIIEKLVELYIKIKYKSKIMIKKLKIN